MVPDKMSPTKNGPQLLECELEFSKVWSRAGAENGDRVESMEFECGVKCRF